MSSSKSRLGLAMALVLFMVAGIAVVAGISQDAGSKKVTAYFANTNGLFVGDEVRILGVRVGTVESIAAEPEKVKVVLVYDDSLNIPADVKAVVLSPTLVTARAVQLTPAYTTGPTLADDGVIPLTRTAVPVEYDDFRTQLEKLSDALQPTQPGGVSTLGAFVNTAADNLRGEGANIRDTLVKLSKAFSALGDNSGNLFATVDNLATLVSALQGSTDLMRQLNVNLAAVSGLLSDGSDEVGTAVRDINNVVTDVQSFIADNRETLGITSEKLASVSQALVASRDDLEQALHIAPNTLQNFVNIYQPAQATLTGALAATNFNDPISFICGAIQAASRMGAEQSAKLCVQYLAPIVKNRQYNFLPLGINPIVGPMARPNEITYSEDWMRPDYIPPPGGPADSNSSPALPAEAPVIQGPADPIAPGTAGQLPPPGNVFTRFGEPADPYHGDPPFVPPRLPDPQGQPPAHPAPSATDPSAGLEGLLIPSGGQS